MKLLHLFLALFTATFFLACSADKEQLQVDTNLTTYSEDMVALQASGALAYSWRQLSGTPVVLINANSATASFIAPSVSTEETLVFELEAVTVKIQEKNITLKKQVQVTVHPKAVVDTGSTSQEAEQEEPQEEVAEAGDTDMNSTSQEAEPEEVEQEQVSSTDMNSTSGEVELEEQSNETNTSTNETNTTQPTVSLKSLKLTLEKTSLNIETNTTLQVIATYDDNTSKDVTDEVTWNLSDTNAAQITQKSLHAKKDTNIFLQAKLGAVTSNTLALEIYKEINGHRLPPEPDSTINNSTLLGIDTNDNGVRDDVERWIYEEYKEKHPIHIDIAMQAGRAYKQVLETPERALEIHETVVNAPLYCAWYYQKGALYFNETLFINNNERIDAPVKSKYFNTKERSDVYWQYDTLLSGGSYPLPKAQNRKSYCDFNTSKYK
ncbi:MAG: hypothetical protein PHS10_03270 [Thiovulaceae bacterium]|nr:hypothetical protein [Sulfurimonadaceae bacterium]